jgi:putative transposase
MVDTNGFIMEVVVHAANTHDSIGGKELLNRIFEERRYDYSRLKKIYADQGYRGAIIELAKEYKWDFEVVQRDANGGFKVLPKRWIVERTFAWFDNFRRLARDYERLASTSEAMIKWAAIIMIHKRI